MKATDILAESSRKQRQPGEPVPFETVSMLGKSTIPAILHNFMLYDRPYMRQGGEPESGQTTAYMTLLFITVGVFVLQQLLNVLFPGQLPYRTNSFFTDWFALSGEHFRQLKAWTPLSYTFLHSTNGIMHILGNMLGLFFLGRILEPLIGRAQFLVLYFGGALLGAFAYLVFHYNDSFPVVGASASVCAANLASSWSRVARESNRFHSFMPATSVFFDQQLCFCWAPGARVILLCLDVL